MKPIQKHLERLRKIKRRQHHPLIHKIHKKFAISKKTLFYVKEYGPHSNIPKTIIRESIKILIFASLVSSFGGLALEQIKPIFVSIIPLIVLLPAINGLIGSFGTVISARFSTMLHEGKVRGSIAKAMANKEIGKLFLQIFIVALIMASAAAILAIFSRGMPIYPLFVVNAAKIFLITIMDVALLVAILFAVAISAGIYIFRKGEDPNNFLIPITTSIADFANMFLLAFLIVLVF